MNGPMAGTFEKDPSANELLVRIVRLENRLSTLQQRDVNPLKEMVAELQGALSQINGGLKYHIKATVDEVGHIHDFLWPLVHKIFPGFAPTQKRVDMIVPPGAANHMADRDRPREDKPGS